MTMCEFNEVYDGMEEGRKMPVARAAKLGRNKEMKTPDKQTEVEDKRKGLTKQEVESHLATKTKNGVKRGVSWETGLPRGRH